MKVVFLGATRGMGRALARLMAERGDRLFLLGRDPDELARSADDLEVLAGGGKVGRRPCDLLQPETFARGARSGRRRHSTASTRSSSPPDSSPRRSNSKRTPRCARDLLTADFTNTIQFCEAGAAAPAGRGGGTLCVFSSVAGERGRKPVILYGAAKAGLSHYLEGLDHKFRAQGLRTICVKPGFVKTGMTAGLKPPPVRRRSPTPSPASCSRPSIAARRSSTPPASGAG